MAGMVMVMVMVLLGKPEFAPGIGGAGSSHPTTTRQERKGEGTSLGTGSDEVSRTSSATQVRKRVTAKETPPKSGVQTPLLGMNCNSVCLGLRMVVSWRGLLVLAQVHRRKFAGSAKILSGTVVVYMN